MMITGIISLFDITEERLERFLEAIYQQKKSIFYSF